MLGFVVESETVNADLAHQLDVVSGVGYVHVAVEVGFGKMGSKALDDGGADCEVGDEMSR